MREYFSSHIKDEVFTPCTYRLVNVGFDLNHTGFDVKIKRIRKDYYVFCVDSGRIIVQNSENNYTVVEKGEFFVYFPGTQQYFWHDGGTKAKKTWVHFMGSEMDDLIKKLKIKEGKIILKQSSKAQEVLGEILKENITKASGYETMSKSLLLKLLTTLARDKTATKALSNNKMYGIMMTIIDIINQNPHISNQQLASTLNMSTDHFVRVFKNFFNTTPHQYKLDIIINTAKSYLMASNLTVNQIAELLGYNNNSLYFNALFKKYTGVSPTDFRIEHNQQKVQRSLIYAKHQEIEETL